LIFFSQLSGYYEHNCFICVTWIFLEKSLLNFSVIKATWDSEVISIDLSPFQVTYLGITLNNLEFFNCNYFFCKIWKIVLYILEISRLKTWDTSISKKKVSLHDKQNKSPHFKTKKSVRNVIVSFKFFCEKFLFLRCLHNLANYLTYHPLLMSAFFKN
jgi:hypothetical protein